MRCEREVEYVIKEMSGEGIMITRSDEREIRHSERVGSEKYYDRYITHLQANSTLYCLSSGIMIYL